MFLGLLLDLGVERDALVAGLGGLSLPGWALEAGETVRGGLAATRVRVVLDGDEPHRGWAEIEAVFEGAQLPGAVRPRALQALRRLVEVEAAIHGVPFERAHLHEAGATDAMVDVAGTLLGLHLLGVQTVSASTPLPLGAGTVECQHGSYPVPAPATTRLLEGVPVTGGPVEAELVTPTGAALLREIVGAWGAAPAGRLLGSGYGAGTRELPGRPNVLRGVLLDSAAGTTTTVAVIETAVDDMNPQDVEPLREHLEEAGALDLLARPVFMKKGRPGLLLTAVCPPAARDAVVEAMLAHTPTLGVRSRLEERRELERDELRVATTFGEVRVKRARRGSAATLQPEFEDCRALAREAGVSVETVRRAALAAAGGGDEKEPTS
jgi:uncharacterized protein (TIGR00299 family) protein